jgi:hypothetical protein
MIFTSLNQIERKLRPKAYLKALYDKMTPAQKAMRNLRKAFHNAGLR